MCMILCFFDTDRHIADHVYKVLTHRMASYNSSAGRAAVKSTCRKQAVYVLKPRQAQVKHVLRTHSSTRLSYRDLARAPFSTCRGAC